MTPNDMLHSNHKLIQMPLFDRSHILDLPAKEMSEAILAGKISCVEIVKESLKRAKIVQENFNAFVVIREEEALLEAIEADKHLKSGLKCGFLYGVPFVAKDLTPTKGDIFAQGSWSNENHIAEHTAPCIKRLQDQGAILIGKTTTPEFAYSSFTNSPRFGLTRNPYNKDHSSGGSSGGSAVAVACGVVPFAEGTDMGGSVRIPSAFCGIFGFKPSLGRIPMTILPSQFDNISHFGPLARTTSDLECFMKATAGFSPLDISSSPLKFTPLDEKIDLSGKRFAYSIDHGYYAVDKMVEDVMTQFIEHLCACGAIVEPIKPQWSRKINDLWLDLWAVFMASFFGDRLKLFEDKMDSQVVELIKKGFTISAVDYKNIEIFRTHLWLDMAKILNEYDGFISPTCAITAPYIHQTDDDYCHEDKQGRFCGLDMTCLFNLLPQCPAISIPIGNAKNGLPVGLQLAMMPNQDEKILAFASAFEQILAKNN